METQHQPELAPIYQHLLAQIREHTSHAKQLPELLAVSKGQSAERVRQLAKLGQRRFGENYVQELLQKAEELRELNLDWVYIGHLQSNKIRKLVPVAAEIQSVSQWHHAELIARAAREWGRTPFAVFIEVKVGEETSKSGADWADVLPLAQKILRDAPELRLRGIMAIPPSIYQDASHPEVPELYHQLRRLADAVGDRQLSLGMSGDLRIALQAGTDQLRIGRALLGPRQS